MTKTRLRNRFFRYFAVRQRGVVIPAVALLLPILLGLSALALDVGTLYGTRRQLQTAADAAALAAVYQMRDQILNPSGSYNPAAAALDFAARNGVPTAGAACTSDYKPTVSSNGSAGLHTWQVGTSRLVPLTFAGALGVPAQCVQVSAQAVADLKMMDVMLSLDTTASMERSGTNDLAALQQAVAGFVTQLNPNSSDPTSPKIGIARFAGIKCNWTWNGSTYTCPTSTLSDDKTVLSDLTFDQNTLTKIAANQGTGSCPLSGSMAPYGCPLASVPYPKPLDNGPFAGYDISDGTKLPNAVSVVSNSGYYAWDSSRGGRNNASGEGNARKVLIIMTDGFNEDFNLPPYWTPPPNENIANYNSQMITLGNQLKSKGVEIYTVGFFCTPYSTDNVTIPQKWCKSTLADTILANGQHPCPDSPTWPPSEVTPSAIDNQLRDWSSSSSGTCDHYFPLSKRESLSAIFQSIAGRLMRVRLTQ